MTLGSSAVGCVVNGSKNRTASGGSRALVATLAAALLASTVPTPAPAQSQTLNVRDADIRVFIQDIARNTGQTFIIDPAVTGTVSVASQRPLNRTELFEVFLSTLRANGLVVARTASGAYRVSPAQTAAQGPTTAGADGFATEVFQFRHIDAASAAETIRPLVGAGGQVLANPRGNTVVVADYADNLRRIRALIQRIDVDRAAFEVVSLRNSSAREIARVLNELLAPPGGGPGLVSVVPVESSNTLILRGEPEAVARIRPLIADLDGRSAVSDNVRVIFLDHADAAQLAPVLQQIVGQAATAPAPAASAGASGAGSAEAAAAPVTGVSGPGMERVHIARFPGANALVVNAPPEIQRMIADVVARLDTRRQQVLVEAIVVELSDEAVRALGVQLLGGGRNGNPLAMANFTNMPSALPIAGAIAAEGELDEESSLLDQVRTSAVSTLLGANGLLFGGAARRGDGLFGAIVNAVQADGNSRLLSTPSLMTLDNESAVILVGQEVPVTTGEVLADNNSNPFRTTQRQDIGVRLEVKPRINAEGAITLTLRQEVSSINGLLTAGAGDLVLNKREIETTLIVDDGDIAVAGGLLDRHETVSVERVPGLSDIPGLGALFRSTRREGAQTNLMIFIRPTIVRSPQEAAALGAHRWDYMRNRQWQADPTREPTLDELVRDYFGSTRPTADAAPTGVVSGASLDPAGR